MACMTCDISLNDRLNIFFKHSEANKLNMKQYKKELDSKYKAIMRCLVETTIALIFSTQWAEVLFKETAPHRKSYRSTLIIIFPSH